MITTAIKDLVSSESLPAMSKTSTEYLQVVFTYEYLKMSGVLDAMRVSGYSEAFINGYIEGVYSALQTIERLSNPPDNYE